MKIATFNCNSVRVRLEDILDWLATNEPDVLALQETKVEDDKFPAMAFLECGYQVAYHGQKTHNGVAIVSRIPFTEVQAGFGDPAMPEDKRVIAATFGDLRIINTYVPNGTIVGGEKWTYKMKWLDYFRGFLDQQIRQYGNVVWLGDINIAPRPEDVYESEKKLGMVGHHPDEFLRLTRIVELGLTDVFRKHTSGAGHYTFWEFMRPQMFERNLGWRIDHIYATADVASKCHSCEVDKSLRGTPRPSDHTVVIADFDL